MKRFSAGYVGVLFLSLAIAVISSWTGLSEAIDGSAYDWIYQRQAKPGPTQAIVLAFDEETLAAAGGMRGLRPVLARVLDTVNAVAPAVVAIDVILSDTSSPTEDAALARSLAATKNLVLASDLLAGGNWEDPLPMFSKAAAAIGHVHARPDPVSRALPLEVASGRVRRWAVCLEALRLVRGGTIIESPDSLDVHGLTVPSSRKDQRSLRIRYLPDSIPTVSVAEVLRDPAAAQPLARKAIFIGVTAQSAARDRLMTPFGAMMSGVEIHAHAFETLRSGQFLVPASALVTIALTLAICLCAGAIFFLFSGWQAYALGGALIALSHGVPHAALARGIILPYSTLVMVAWLSVAFAAAWMYFSTRRQLRVTETDKARYRQAIQFVTHEMRSPLTAIQGSSELMGRYNLDDTKRKQMAGMINAESKRLARMIQTFLDLERLSDGSMEFKKEIFDLGEVVDSCLGRAAPLADRKQIQLVASPADRIAVTGDKELLEYAIYNLITNAIKYSPPNTIVNIRRAIEGGTLKLSVADQGIGIDESDLKHIFKKFYRTRKAETSGEAGTGIGLSIVEQIVHHHNGRMEVTSALGKGSCFTMVLPRTAVSEANLSPRPA